MKGEIVNQYVRTENGGKIAGKVADVKMMQHVIIKQDFVIANLAFKGCIVKKCVVMICGD